MLEFDKSELGRICRKHDVARLRIFGSASRGDETKESDIDLLVDFDAPKGLFALIRLEDELATFFGRQVDLLTEPGLSPYLGFHTLQCFRDIRCRSLMPSTWATCSSPLSGSGG